MQAEIDELRAALAHPTPSTTGDAVPQAWTNLLAYVLQDDMHNRLTPRVIDIAYTSFTLAKQPNKEDGGASDWFNDTKPTVAKMIEKLRKDLVEELAPAEPAPNQEQALQRLSELGQELQPDEFWMAPSTAGERYKTIERLKYLAELVWQITAEDKRALLHAAALLQSTALPVPAKEARVIPLKVTDLGSYAFDAALSETDKS